MMLCGKGNGCACVSSAGGEGGARRGMAGQGRVVASTGSSRTANIIDRERLPDWLGTLRCEYTMQYTLTHTHIHIYIQTNTLTVSV